jgi:hypothetical protein
VGLRAVLDALEITNNATAGIEALASKLVDTPNELTRLPIIQ